MPATYDDPADCVDAIIDRLGTEIRVGAPLGIGKANHLLNALVHRAVENPDIDLEIWSALTLSPPDWDSALERRLVQPLADRLFDAYPRVEYDRLLQAGRLPENIEVHQFYYQPGKYIGNPTAQQFHHSVNYTHALETFQDADPNLLLQLVGVGELDGERYFNFGSNTDISQDLLASMLAERDREERDLMIVGQVNRNMPFMYGDAPVSPEKFDAVLDDEAYDFPLFAPPEEPISLSDYAIGLRVSALVPDGGTLQIGIGSLGTAIGRALELRHRDNDTYREAIDALGVREDAPALVDDWGGLDPFETGLYGATEMFVEAFLHLYDAGVLDRRVYDDPGIQRLADAGHEAVDVDTLDALLEHDVVPASLDAGAVDYLQRWGVFSAAVSYDSPSGGTDGEGGGTDGEGGGTDGEGGGTDGEGGGTDGESGGDDGRLVVDGAAVPADLSRPETRAALAERGLGDSLADGKLLHAGFFLGSRTFYERLREMDDDERRQLAMCSVQFTNELYGREELKRRQRRDARFVNTGMKATATGAVVSDGLADGRVVSGVGGQFNFVNQAHELDDGRSVILVRATRESGGEVRSNIVWNYGHVTVPRHLRDIVVTEYGVADLHGKSDREVVAEMIGVADSRFQDDLVEQAKAAGKLPADWELPEQDRHNYPDSIERALGEFRERETLPEFPYGRQLTEEELALGRALRGLQSDVEARNVRALADAGALRKTVQMPDAAGPYLERMGLAEPSTLRERALGRAVVLALAEHGVI
jgi:acyl-CoA hydrolase